MSSTTNTVYTTSSLITLLPSEPSICIPRLFMNIQKERVHDVFADLFGHNAIERVDMIERKNNAGEEYKRAFVHFKSWPRTEQSTEVRLKLLNGDQVKIMYDQPWFWLISASRVPRPEQQHRKEAVPSRPFIMIEKDVPQRHEQSRPLQARDIAPYQDAPRGYERERRDELRPQHHHQHRHQVQRYDTRPPRRDERYDSRDRRYDHRDQRQADYYDRRERDCYEPRSLQARDISPYQAPRSYEHERRDTRNHYQSRPHQERHDERSSYTRRLDIRRPPNVDVTIEVTPKKSAPEIVEWIEKSKKIPGAPVKKPRLVLADDEAGAGAGDMTDGERTTNVKNRGRKLTFDESSSSDDEAVPPVHSAPSTPPVQPSSSSSDN